MHTLEDYLIYYNIKDVTPFLEALDTMFGLCRDALKVDIFKQAISVPRLTLQILFNSIVDGDAFFFGEKDKDLYQFVKNRLWVSPA